MRSDWTILCLFGLHRWGVSVDPDMEVCYRAPCQKRRCIKGCNWVIVHEDNACRLERCSNCGDLLKLGDC